LYQIPIIKICATISFVIKPIERIPPSTNAKRKLVKGPAKDTSIISLFLCLKYIELTGTGLAHPNLKINKNKNPVKSICLIGFKVKRPAFLAVGSPNL